jgi:alkanesulfonate monooxygenase SsuD/methylene tetrahydromethanopterin reductase-like flavin-dependent oxidoreductase (luciferase family)
MGILLDRLSASRNNVSQFTSLRRLGARARKLAKMAQQIEHISGGRFAINLVNAWNRPELERAGIGFAEHDERYAYGCEWISVVDALLRGETVDHRGDHFRIDGYQLHPADPFRARPRIYVGGESEPARSLVAAHGDVWFINGQPYEDVARLIADVSARKRPGGHEPLRFGLSAFVIARETQAQADVHLEHLFELAELDKPLRERHKANIDPNVVMIQNLCSIGSCWIERGNGSGTRRRLRHGRAAHRGVSSRGYRAVHASVPAFRGGYAQLRGRSRAASSPAAVRLDAGRLTLDSHRCVPSSACSRNQKKAPVGGS